MSEKWDYDKWPEDAKEEISRLKEENETLKQRMIDISADYIKLQYDLKDLQGDVEYWKKEKNDWHNMYQETYDELQEVKAKLSEKGAEIERLKGTAFQREARIVNYATKLSRYEQGIEVEGTVVTTSRNFNTIGGLHLALMPFLGKRVKVIVMTCEEGRVMNDDRIKQLMEQTPMPNSLSSYNAFKQLQNEMQQEIDRLTAELEKYRNGVEVTVVDDGTSLGVIYCPDVKVGEKVIVLRKDSQ